MEFTWVEIVLCILLLIVSFCMFIVYYHVGRKKGKDVSFLDNDMLRDFSFVFIYFLGLSIGHFCLVHFFHVSRLVSVLSSAVVVFLLLYLLVKSGIFKKSPSPQFLYQNHVDKVLFACYKDSKTNHDVYFDCMGKILLNPLEGSKYFLYLHKHDGEIPASLDEYSFTDVELKAGNLISAIYSYYSSIKGYKYDEFFEIGHMTTPLIRFLNSYVTAKDGSSYLPEDDDGYVHLKNYVIFHVKWFEDTTIREIQQDGTDFERRMIKDYVTSSKSEKEFMILSLMLLLPKIRVLEVPAAKGGSFSVAFNWDALHNSNSGNSLTYDVPVSHADNNEPYVSVSRMRQYHIMMDLWDKLLELRQSKSDFSDVLEDVSMALVNLEKFSSYYQAKKHGSSDYERFDVAEVNASKLFYPFLVMMTASFMPVADVASKRESLAFSMFRYFVNEKVFTDSFGNPLALKDIREGMVLYVTPSVFSNVLKRSAALVENPVSQSIIKEYDRYSSEDYDSVLFTLFNGLFFHLNVSLKIKIMV